MLQEANILEKKNDFVQITRLRTLYFGERNYRAGVQRVGFYGNGSDAGRRGGRNRDRSYFLRARSKICCIQVQIHPVLCFVGKDQNYFGFTDVWGIWRKQMEQIRALAVKDCLAKRQQQDYWRYKYYKWTWKFSAPPVRPLDFTVCGRGLHDWQWLTPGDADSSYERQRPSSAGSAGVQPDASSGWNSANTTSRLCVIRSFLAKSWTDLRGLNGRAGIMTSLGRAEAASTAWRAEAPT